MVGRILLLCGALALLATCGEPERDNPFDPSFKDGEVLLRRQIVGEWERDADGENQVYAFKADGAVEWRDYSAPDGGPVDRTAPFPQTLVLTYSGTYVLEGRTLKLVFTQVQTNEPAGVKSPPDDDARLLRVALRGDLLTLSEGGRDRRFSRLF